MLGTMVYDYTDSRCSILFPAAATEFSDTSFQLDKDYVILSKGVSISILRAVLVASWVLYWLQKFREMTKLEAKNTLPYLYTAALSAGMPDTCMRSVFRNTHRYMHVTCRVSLRFISFTDCHNRHLPFPRC